MINKFLIPKDSSIKTAMKQLGASSNKILFVIDASQVLFGTVTDGDIRRWILRNGSLNKKVEAICNRRPVCVQESKYILEEVKKIMINQKIECIPVVDSRKKIVNALFWENIFGEKYKKPQKKLNVPVVIMAGGQGQRMSLFTKIWPKPLIPVGEKPVIELVMDSFHENGCDDFSLVLKYKAEMIKSYFENANIKYKVRYVEEPQPRGTAGGLRFLPKNFGKTFFLSNCDIIVREDYEDMYKFHKNYGNDITIVASYKHFVVPYGVIKSNRQALEKIIEKPEHDYLVVTGMYILEKSVINFIPRKNEAFHMPDLINKVKQENGKVGIYPISENAWTDVGELEKYKETLKQFDI
jgi:dTDP-glucose pyrophosphorylase